MFKSNKDKKCEVYLVIRIGAFKFFLVNVPLKYV